MKQFFAKGFYFGFSGSFFYFGTAGFPIQK